MSALRERSRGVLPAVLPWLFPALVVLAVVVLAGLDLSGSSLPLNGAGARDPSVVAGTPRSIRTDEFALSTPNLIGNDRRGNPVRPWIGLNRTFLPATGVGVAAEHWTELFKPYEWGFFALDPSHAFALRWWLLPAIGLLGCYALLRLVTGRTLLSVGIAVLAVCTPYAAWWSLTPALSIGFLTGAVACGIAALRRRRAWACAGFGLAAGYLAFCGFMVLYPPWQVSVAWIGIAVLAGEILDRRPGWRRPLLTAAAALLVLVPAGLVWYVQGKAAIMTTAQTVYPGNRISTAGETSLRFLLDAPSSLALSLSDLHVRPTDTSFTGKQITSVNQTAIASSWIPLPLMAAAVVLLAWVWLGRRRVRGTAGGPEAGRPDPIWTWTLVTAATALLLAWAVLPMPAWFGAVTLLNRVPGARTPAAIGLGAALMLGIGARVLSRNRPPWWLVGVAALGAVATVPAMTVAVLGLHWTRHHPSTRLMLEVSTLFAVGAGVLLTGRLVRVAALWTAAVALICFVPVNPLVRGLGPLQDDPVVVALRPYARPGHATNVTVYSPRGPLTSLVTASGVENLSGLTVYPDVALMTSLDPGQRNQWNAFAKFTWIPDPGAGPVRITAARGTNQTLAVDPCAPAILALPIDVAVSGQPIPATVAPCLGLLRTVPWRDGPVYLYRVDRSGRDAATR